MTKLTPRTWYLVGLGLMISAATMAVVAWSQMSSTVAAMPRVVMPGKATLTVPAGGSTLYFERESVVDGKAYHVGSDFSYRCVFEEKDRATIKPSPGKVRYSIGDYSGRNTFDVDATQAGTYTLVCDSDGKQTFVLAIGRGVGSAIVVAVIGLLPFLAGLFVVIFVAIRRHMQKKAAG